MDDGGGEGVEDGKFVNCFVLGLGRALGACCSAGFPECVFYGFVGCEECAGCLLTSSVSTDIYMLSHWYSRGIWGIYAEERDIQAGIVDSTTLQTP